MYTFCLYLIYVQRGGIMLIQFTYTLSRFLLRFRFLSPLRIGRFYNVILHPTHTKKSRIYRVYTLEKRPKKAPKKTTSIQRTKSQPNLASGSVSPVLTAAIVDFVVCAYSRLGYLPSCDRKYCLWSPQTKK